MPPSDRWDVIASSGCWGTLSGEQASGVIEGARSLKLQKDVFCVGSIVYALKSSFGMAGQNWARHRGIFRATNAGSGGGGFGFGVLLNGSQEGYWFGADTDNFSGATTGYLVKGGVGELADFAGSAGLLDSFALHGDTIFLGGGRWAFELVYDRDPDTGIVTLTASFGQMGALTEDFDEAFANLAQMSQVTDSTYSSGTVGIGASSLQNGNGYTFNFDVIETWIPV